MSLSKVYSNSDVSVENATSKLTGFLFTRQGAKYDKGDGSI